jgi:class 3 adenylate cyclase/predicted ATPase
MTFEEMLDHALAMLQRRGRLTYRTLQRQFHLDDDALNDLKDALIYAHPEVHDDAGRGLVWTGESSRASQRALAGLVRYYGDAAVLVLVRALLQREGRLSYSRLRRICGLDEAGLADLCEDLLFQRLARDEDGKGLVWMGSAPPPGMVAAVFDTTIPPTSAAPLLASDSTLPESLQDVPMLALEPSHRALEAERRQVTVMFCDLVASTELSQQLDPEDYRAVVRAYQAAAAAALQPYDGYIAQYLGDGLLVYFGWPQAHEDAAYRAVYASLALLDAMGPLHETHLVPRYRVQVAVRIGLHTGLAVIGAMGGGDRSEQLAMGDTPNLAARIQGLAAPNTVALSAATVRLVQGAFVLEDLGTHALKGVAEPMPVYRVLGPIEAHHDEDEAPTPGVPTLVGRDEEIGLLRRRWDQAREGLGQVVLVSGEAGIGKSALVRTARHHIGQEGVMRMTYHCSPYHMHSAFYPIIVHLERLFQFERDDLPGTRLSKLERLLTTYPFPLEEVVPLFAALLSVPLPEGAYPTLALTPQQQRQHTHDALLAWLVAEAERQPVLVVWDDVHWADPSTLENLALLVAQIPTSPILAVLTFRPEFVPPWPPRSHMTSLTLNRLERPQIEALVRQQAGGKTLPREVVAHIVAKTDGVPLFVEELTKMILESALLREETDHYALTGTLSAVTIPATLQDSLLARLDRLPTMREVAQIGAVIGREFAYEVLHALVTVDERTLLEGLGQLVATELLYQRGRPPRATYTFKHALVQDAAYQSLLRRTRQQYHQQVAELLEARFSETVATAPEVVAHHYTEAGCAAQALPLWQQAGERALQRSANLEAIEHLTKGLAVLATLPETTDRLQHELDLHVTLGPALMATRGYAAPEVEHTFARAWALCQRLGEGPDGPAPTQSLQPPQRFPVLYGLCVLYWVGGKHRQARAQAEQFLHLAQRQEDTAPLVVAHRALGLPLYFMGEVSQAREHFARALALYDPQQHRTLAFAYGHDPGVAALVFDAFALWMLGYPEQAMQRSHEACTLTEGLAHPHTRVYAFWHLAVLHQHRREQEEARRSVEVATRVSREQGFPLWLGLSLILQGWARATRPQPAEQIPSMHEGMAMYRATDAEMWLPYLLTLLAETYGAAGQPEAGLRLLDEAHTVMDNTQERFYEAEMRRVQGALMLAQTADQHALAETCFQHALDVARRQQARSWELRAAMSLGRLWQQQGKRAEAPALLAPVYGWFTEGFDTADLQEAKTLLDELGE